MNDLELAFPEKHTVAKIDRLAKKYTRTKQVNELLEKYATDVEALARLLTEDHLKPGTHRVLLDKAEPERHCSLLFWACKIELDSRLELIALLLACGADPDAPEECMPDQTPREYVHECLSELCLERMSEQHHYVLNLMGEPRDDYPAHWALKYAAGNGYFYGVQLLSKKCTVAQAAIEHNEVKYDEAKDRWDMYSFMMHHPDEDRTWFDELREHMRILERINAYLDPIANAPVPRLGE